MEKLQLKRKKSLIHGQLLVRTTIFGKKAEKESITWSKLFFAENPELRTQLPEKS